MESNIINPFGGSGAVTRPGASSSQQADSARAIAEVQAALMIARMNPRDEKQAVDRILNSCTRRSLAENALYAYERGGTAISGPSIRLAEAIAQNWGNIQFGIRELSNSGGKSEVQAFAWDVETNTRREVTFTVPHTRYRRKGSYKLDDPRDIYEAVANNGARRLRACILAIIPGDVVDAAVAQCEVTLKNSVDTSPESIKKLLASFEQFNVSKAQIEKRCQCRAEAINSVQILNLRKVWKSLHDGMSVAADWFEPIEPPKKIEAKQTLEEKLEARKADAQAKEEALEPATETTPETVIEEADLPDQGAPL